MNRIKGLKTKYFPLYSDRIFFLCGAVMLCSEIWKQLTLTFLLGHGHYNWWYFPFQLCSIPMYILLAYPWLRAPGIRSALLGFLMSYTLLGGIAVFADTSGLHYPLASLTAHSYLWHILLIAVGLFAGSLFSSGTARLLPAFASGTCLYLSCCLLAEIFNLALDRFGTINMFYINPHYQMQQIFFHSLSLSLGNLPAILLYIAATVFGAFLLSLLWHVPGRFVLHRFLHRNP